MQPNTITVQVDRPGAAISPTMFGLFFEDINFGADGGLYPERVKNRSFEFPRPDDGLEAMWLAARPKGRCKFTMPVRETIGLTGITCAFKRTPAAVSVSPMKAFAASAWNRARNTLFSDPGARRQTMRPPDGCRSNWKTPMERKLGEAVISLSATLNSIAGRNRAWKDLYRRNQSHGDERQGALELLVDGPGKIDVDLISLYPKETWKNRPNGLRTDLVQLLSDMKPGFLRFPGGCIVEGQASGDALSMEDDDRRSD